MSRKIIIATAVAVTWVGAMVANIVWLQGPNRAGTWVVVVANLAAGLATMVGVPVLVISAVRRARGENQAVQVHAHIRGAISLAVSLVVAESIVLAVYGVQHPEYLLGAAVIVPIMWAYLRPRMRARVDSRRDRV